MNKDHFNYQYKQSTAAYFNLSLRFNLVFEIKQKKHDDCFDEGFLKSRQHRQPSSCVEGEINIEIQIFLITFQP